MTVTAERSDSSLLRSTNFILTCTRVPDLTFFCQEFNPPSILMGATTVATPMADVIIPGDRLNFGDTCDARVIIDEAMLAYDAMYRWLIEVRDYNDSNLHLEPRQSWADISVAVLGNNLQRVAYFRITDCFPAALGNLTFRTTEGGDRIMTCDVKFYNNGFSFERYDPNAAIPGTGVIGVPQD